MKKPATELDTRFSDQDAVATDWEETRRALEHAELFWISTVRADGRPHVTPLVAVWLDDTIYFATGPSEQKAVNLRTNQNMILTTGCNEWKRGLDVVVEGEAVKVSDESVLERLAETWATKWDGRWHYEVHDRGFRHEGGSGAVLVFWSSPQRCSRSPKAPSVRRATGSRHLRAAHDGSLFKGGLPPGSSATLGESLTGGAALCRPPTFQGGAR
jgi:nitroimidazol reductase NimA-like FMN-containing flavoprotein (pyridoxamine 5'-phosphate oxidase superfamily)